MAASSADATSRRFTLYDLSALPGQMEFYAQLIDGYVNGLMNMWEHNLLLAPADSFEEKTITLKAAEVCADTEPDEIIESLTEEFSKAGYELRSVWAPPAVRVWLDECLAKQMKETK